MRKLLLISVFMMILTAGFAQEKKMETFSDDKFGISLQYNSNQWLLILDKKFMGSNYTKDYAVIKRHSSFENVRIHQLYLNSKEDFELRMKAFRDLLVRERIAKWKGYSGIINRQLTAEEIQNFGCSNGIVLGYEFVDGFGFVNQGFIYFMQKDKKVYVVELYVEKSKRDPKFQKEAYVYEKSEDITAIREILASFKIK